jgi:type IV pilus assembly protein PilM
MRIGKQKSNNVVGLDFEAGSIAAAEVQVNGGVRVTKTAVAPLAAGIFHEGEVLDPEKLADDLKSLFGANKLSKKVRLGVANQRMVVRTLRLPAIEDPKEMEAAIRFQAQEQMPMPLDDAVLEHQMVGGVPGEEDSAPQVDVIVVAARREMVSSILKPLRRAGLEPVGVDLSAFAMIRALAGPNAESGTGPGERPAGAVLYCSVGDVTNLAVARGRSCLFTRVSYAGLETIGARLGSTRGLTPEHATQWLSHVGLDTPLESVPGDPETVSETRAALEEGVSSLLDEMRLSLDYYGAQEGALPVESVVLCGQGAAIPGLAERMESGLGLGVAASTPGPLEALGADAARLTLPFGLALEE